MRSLLAVCLGVAGWALMSGLAQAAAADSPVAGPKAELSVQATHKPPSAPAHKPRAKPKKPDADAVASANPLATAAGIAIMQSGGNAFDAAVAVSAVLAVVEPYSSGLGGGGFWLLHRASDGHEVMIDGRERAPLAATADMYLDQQGKPVPGLSMNGALAAGIPGEPAALQYLARHYGRLPLAVSLAPAIALAEHGFKVDDYYRRLAQFRLAVLKQSPAAAAQFLDRGKVPAVGYLLKQPELAATLRHLAEQGADGFYRGAVAKRLVDGVRAAGGIWTLKDLADYKVVARTPVIGEYHGLRVVSASLPSSGGIVLLEMLNMLEPMHLSHLASADQVQRMIEVMRRAYEDRALYLGDPDFAQIPVRRLIDKGYARVRMANFNPNHAGVSKPMAGVGTEGPDTTHFSIIDRDGNYVAATLSINYPFGSGFVPPGTGVLLNDEMDDFSIKPGTPNAYGLVGNQANAIAPGKRMLSSMTPTFVQGKDSVAILGTPGGSRIISMVLIGVLQAAQGAPVQQWVGRARFHHQYLPDEVQYEPDALSPATAEILRKKGYHLDQLRDVYGNMQAVEWNKLTGQVSAASDPRGVGAAYVTNAKGQ